MLKMFKCSSAFISAYKWDILILLSLVSMCLLIIFGEPKTKMSPTENITSYCVDGIVYFSINDIENTFSVKYNEYGKIERCN